MGKFDLSSVIEGQIIEKSDSTYTKIFSVKISKENLQKAIDNTTREIAKFASVPGFRLGKAPISMVRNRYMKAIKEELFGEIIRTAFSVKLPETVNKFSKMSNVLSYNYDKVGTPEIIDPEQDFSFSVELEFAPKIDLPDYHSLKVDVKKEEVTEAEIDGEIKRLQMEYGKYNEARDDESVAEEDMLEVKVVSDIELEESSSSEAKRLVQNDRMFLWLKDSVEPIPGFHKALIGKKKGEIVKLGVDFPADFRVVELAGKKANYEITINKIQKFVPLSDTEELVKKLNLKDLQALKEKIRELITNSKEYKYKEACRGQLLDILKKETPDFELPKSLRDEFFNYEVDTYVRAHIRSEEDRVEFEKKREEHMEKIRSLADEKLKEFLILREISNRENIEITEKDISDAEENFCRANRLTPSEFKKYRTDRLRNLIYNFIMERKVLDHLYSSNIEKSESKNENANKEGGN
ncbi:MAG TPA: trigger factor [Victivallales bacterium]|nr:trigger factor [Victivallales bacterium]HPO90120.1 trigger factor [Victivallales bacterium]HRR06512.1 trigger factor [Victivallales bacterium]HRR28172.1 trigger factor [Victivallales bacterium]